MFQKYHKERDKTFSYALRINRTVQVAIAKTILVLSNRLDFTKDRGRISVVSLFVTLYASVTISLCKKEGENLHRV